MTSGPNKAEEIWKGKFHSTLDRGDIRRMLLAVAIIGAFALLEVGIFFFTMDEKIEGSKGRQEGPALAEGLTQAPGLEKSERQYLQIYMGIMPEEASPQMFLTTFEKDKGTLACEDTSGSEQELPLSWGRASCQ